MAKRTPLEVRRSYTLGPVRAEPAYRMPEGFFYSPKGKPCTDKFSKLKKKKCLVQLTFDRGQPVLRFCKTAKKPGRIVPVFSAGEAARIAAETCACFERTKSFDTCLPRNGALGRLRKRRRRR